MGEGEMGRFFFPLPLPISPSPNPTIFSLLT